MPTQQNGNKIILGTRGFRRVNEHLSPELLEEDELQVMENLVLDNYDKIPSLRQGLSVYNSNTAMGFLKLDDFYINYNDYLFATTGGHYLSTPTSWPDGNVVVSTSIVLSKDMYYNSLTVTNTGIIDENNYRIFVNPINPVVNNGHIHNDGASGYSATAITGLANNGSGLFRVTAPNHGFPNGTTVQINGCTGLNEVNANGYWVITLIDANTFDLGGSTFGQETVNAVTYPSNPAVIQTSATNHYKNGDTVKIAGVSGATSVNGTWVITLVGSSTFTIPVAANAALTGNGTCIDISNGVVSCAGAPAAKLSGTYQSQGQGLAGATGPHTGYGKTNGVAGNNAPTRSTCLTNTAAATSGGGGNGGNSSGGSTVDAGGNGGAPGSPSSVTLVVTPTISQIASASVQVYIAPLSGSGGSGAMGGGSITNGVAGSGADGGSSGPPAGILYFFAGKVTGTGSFTANGGNGGAGGVGSTGNGPYFDPSGRLAFRTGGGGGGGAGAGGPAGLIIMDCTDLTGFTGTISAVGGLAGGVGGAYPMPYASDATTYTVSTTTGSGVKPAVVSFSPTTSGTTLVTEIYSVAGNTAVIGTWYYGTDYSVQPTSSISLTNVTGNGNYISGGKVVFDATNFVSTQGGSGQQGYTQVGNNTKFSTANIVVSGFYSSLNGTGAWSSVQSPLTSPYLCRAAAYGGKLYVTDGADPLFATDMVNAAYNIALTKPDISGVTCVGSTTSPAGGGLTINKTYIYCMVYGDQDGNLSPMSHPFLFDTEAVVGGLPVYYDTNSMSNLPVSSNTRINKRYLYRTLALNYDPAGTGQTDPNFYLLTTLDNTVTSYVDTTPDGSLGLAYTPEFVNTPNFAKYIIIKNDRMFLANIQTTNYNLPMFPTFSSSVDAETNTATGLVPASTYKFAFSFSFNNGAESELQDPFSYTTGAAGGGGNNFKNVDIGGSFPSWGTIMSNVYPMVTKVNLYRTTAGGSTLFYDTSYPISTFIAQLAFSILVDSNPDASLGSTYPAKSTVPVTQSFPSRLVFSDSYEMGTFNILNFIDVGGDTGDTIQGMVDDEDGIIIFKQTNIYKLYTNGATSSWYVQRLVNGIGCDEPNSIIKTPFGIFFKNQGYIYQFTSGSQPQIVSYEFSTSIASAGSWMQVTFSEPREWLVFPVTVGGYPYLFILDLKKQAWYRFPVYNGQSSILWTAYSRKYGADVGKLVTGADFASTVGFYDPSTNLDTHIVSQTPIAHLRTKTFSFPLSVNLVRPRKLWANITRLTGSYTLTHTLTSQASSATSSDAWTGTPAIDLYLITDSMTTPLLTAKNFWYDVSGAGLSTMTALQLESTILKRGTRG